jgi:hypothetical protein
MGSNSVFTTTRAWSALLYRFCALSGVPSGSKSESSLRLSPVKVKGTGMLADLLRTLLHC